MNTITSQETRSEKCIITSLLCVIERIKRLLDKTDCPAGIVKIQFTTINNLFQKIYGPDFKREIYLPVVQNNMTQEQTKELFRLCLSRLDIFLKILNEAPNKILEVSKGDRVFIGHGRSPIWLELKDFLQERLKLSCEEFNQEPAPGISTTERLEHMLNVSSFAFLLMTAEDGHADMTLHARANVIHEVGLFQGRLGTRRAIILLEEGCQQFSNIHGLSHIPFPPNRLSATFEQIRRVLEREGLIKA